MEFLFQDDCKKLPNCETISDEFKKFTFTVDSKLYDLRDLIKTSQWRFNDEVIESLIKYLTAIMPKYITAFNHPLSEIEIGKLYIGVEDDGTQEGIPFEGDLNEYTDVINELISRIIDELIICKNKEELKNNIKFKIEKIKYENKKNIHEYNPLINKYDDEVIKIEAKKQKHKDDYDTWFKEFSRYMKPIAELFNVSETRSEIIEYIDKEINNKAEYYELFELFYSSSIIDCLNHTEMYPEKQNLKSPYYWICKWRDVKMKDILSRKPKKYRTYCPFFTPDKIIGSMSSMISYWMEHNKTLNLYIITFDFIKIKLEDIKYIDTKTGNILSCYRGMSNRYLCIVSKHKNMVNEPCCIPIG
jgi:hypothetical protein